MKLKGTITALVTPFQNGEIDFKSLNRLIEHQVQNGVTGFVINGTTGESPTLNWNEIEALFKFVKSKVSTSISLIMGTGSNSTKKTIEMSQKAEALGVDAFLVVVPYYNKPPQRGLVSHFKAVAESVSGPLILYNVPSRTITSLDINSIIELSRVPNIVGIKEASGQIEFAREIRRQCGSDFILLSGDDGSYPDFLGVGGDGVISVATHLIPKVFSLILADLEGMRPTFDQYQNLISLLFREANPIPVKKALEILKIIDSAELRLPLVELDKLLEIELTTELKKVGLL